MFQPCILIPTYNDASSMGVLLSDLESHGLKMLVINDGSNAPTTETLRGLQAKHSNMLLIEREVNGGKGAAVQTGLRKAAELGFSHALQIDADGQHDHSQIPQFLDEARQYPEHLILGAPSFGEDVPKSRLYGRQVSRLMAWLETLSFQIEDPLFGFRVYPLQAVSHLLARVNLGQRMDFDPEIAVRLCWQGLKVRNIKSQVCYPDGNVSHFQMFRDNMRLSWLHTRLISGMLLRSPLLLVRKLR